MAFEAGLLMVPVEFKTFPPADLPAVLADPCWLPHHVDARSGALEMLLLDRDARRAATFLDDEYLGAVPMRTRIAASAVPRPRPAEAAPVHFIFHSAFACSTLMARIFDIPGTSASLSEPAILNDLAHLSRQGRPVRGLLDPVLALLGRGFSKSESVIVKPSNVANNLVDEILAIRPDAHALILYTPLRDFLFSVARKGMFGRIWARRTFALLRGDELFDAGFSEQETFAQTDLQIAASAWLAHHAQFADLARRYPGRVRTLDSRTLLARKADSIGAAATLFDLHVDAPAIASGPAFRFDAKRIGQQFDRDELEREDDRARDAHGEEIDMIVGWAEAVADFLHVPMRPGAPLLPGTLAA